MFYTHINRNIINSNRKNGTDEPAVRYQKGYYGKPVYCLEVRLPVGAVVRYKPHGDPLLPCGARLVIETELEPEVLK